MKQKYINEIYNLTTNTDENRVMSGNELRARIDNAFINSAREMLNKKAEKGVGIKILPLEKLEDNLWYNDRYAKA
tara:strand:- start:298 stop:522 length:225 start_codon:yes stop_codon:yes gene_type:complete